MRRANRKDKVHGPIVEGLRKHGVAVLDMPDPGDVITWVSRGSYDSLATNLEMFVAAGDVTNEHARRDVLLACKILRQLAADGLYKPIEFKSDKTTRNYTKEATAAQERRARVMPIPIAHTLAEALDLFGIEERS